MLLAGLSEAEIRSLRHVPPTAKLPSVGSSSHPDGAESVSGSFLDSALSLLPAHRPSGSFMSQREGRAKDSLSVCHHADHCILG